MLPLLAAALPVIGAGIDAASTAAQNRKSREFSREMYDRTKSDNLAFWDMQNKYNSPQSQMQRLNEAGLNPNLVYGGSGPSGQAGPIPTPDVQAAQFRSANFAGAAAQSASNLAEFQNLDIRQAQLDNLFLHGSVLKQEALLKAAQIGKTVAETTRSNFDLDFATELRETSADFLRAQVDKQKADLQFTLSQTEINQAQSASNIAEATERILTSRLQRKGMDIDQQKTRSMIRGLNLDNQIKSMDLQFYKEGIPPGSPFYMKMVSTLVDRLEAMFSSKSRSSTPSVKEDVTNSINDFFKRPAVRNRGN